MEIYIWRLLTAIFLLLASVVLGVIALLFQDVAIILGICFYGALFCGLSGLAKGVIVILEYHNNHKTQE